jgi:hypothetical protein
VREENRRKRPRGAHYSRAPAVQSVYGVGPRRILGVRSKISRDLRQLSSKQRKAIRKLAAELARADSLWPNAQKRRELRAANHDRGRRIIKGLRR